MAKKIEDVRMEPASNGGYIVCYTEVTKNKNSEDTYSNRSYDYKKDVFEDKDKAVARLTELAEEMSASKDLKI